ncbi:fatty acid desaturase family protein [Streptomyces sp. NPDC002917]|uniref:fatty acid desaturase family protein n=1 Tax=unclassified Streptomyces TaxID=2593676 RepID=UPI002E802C17|nr:acyl-CoA desaturase [Streptomyces sp. NBC_00562]WTC77411.1 acyl-CoA desaturase [Streptomyces sp. NBC_01653]WTD38080.1 acyl-CoA desaturase [Streptomyces sp. NBC_01643]WTD93450.1 acyl-CoA desaturase [Streptomyces sp. NBC_01637]WTF25749.1 acyl-CoA desaturase [Streptomyces sp. NBC_01602]WUC24429.1 acyl-CoA desaturase [Streptomyces sp. NBC_00562]
MPQAVVTVADRPRDRAGSTDSADGSTGVGGRAAGVGGSDFAPLLRAVKAQGLLERRTGWYAAVIAGNLLALGGVLTGLVLLGNTWWALLLALPLAILWSRTAFVGHDAGHAQITGDRRASRIIGLVHANLLLGMNEAWWNDKHVRHHANPNHIDKDPDVGVGALVWTQKQAAQREGFARRLTRNQARLFFPMLLLEGIALKISGFQYLRQQPARERVLSALLLVTHLGLYATLLLTVMSPGKAVVFALVHHALFGLHLGMAFAPNHKGMEMPDPDGDRWGHLQRQVLTSRNVRGAVLTDWFLGGLNYQIEHHLFPSMPRPHLRRAQPLVRAHCESLGMPYAETGLVESYRQALQHMHEVGEPLRQRAETPR